MKKCKRLGSQASRDLLEVAIQPKSGLMSEWLALTPVPVCVSFTLPSTPAQGPGNQTSSNTCSSWLSPSPWGNTSASIPFNFQVSWWVSALRHQKECHPVARASALPAGQYSLPVGAFPTKIGGKDGSPAVSFPGWPHFSVHRAGRARPALSVEDAAT